MLQVLESKPSEKMVEQIRESLAEVKQKLAELKKRLSKIETGEGGKGKEKAKGKS
jgi:paraquat-inducible protein B